MKTQELQTQENKESKSIVVATPPMVMDFGYLAADTHFLTRLKKDMKYRNEEKVSLDYMNKGTGHLSLLKYTRLAQPMQNQSQIPEIYESVQEQLKHSSFIPAEILFDDKDNPYAIMSTSREHMLPHDIYLFNSTRTTTEELEAAQERGIKVVSIPEPTTLDALADAIHSVSQGLNPVLFLSEDAYKGFSFRNQKNFRF